jgi:hypothetical protein
VGDKLTAGALETGPLCACIDEKSAVGEEADEDDAIDDELVDGCCCCCCCCCVKLLWLRPKPFPLLLLNCKEGEREEEEGADAVFAC